MKLLDIKSKSEKAIKLLITFVGTLIRKNEFYFRIQHTNELYKTLG